MGEMVATETQYDFYHYSIIVIALNTHYIHQLNYMYYKNMHTHTHTHTHKSLCLHKVLAQFIDISIMLLRVRVPPAVSACYIYILDIEAILVYKTG